ncbi:MAG: hypothetical protein AABX50_00190 [Nanoarchaeota archaeon]
MISALVKPVLKEGEMRRIRMFPGHEVVEARYEEGYRGKCVFIMSNGDFILVDENWMIEKEEGIIDYFSQASDFIYRVKAEEGKSIEEIKRRIDRSIGN